METGRGRGSADGIDNNAGDGIDGKHEEKPHEKTATKSRACVWISVTSNERNELFIRKGWNPMKKIYEAKKEFTTEELEKIRGAGVVSDLPFGDPCGYSLGLRDNPKPWKNLKPGNPFLDIEIDLHL